MPKSASAVSAPQPVNPGHGYRWPKLNCRREADVPSYAVARSMRGPPIALSAGCRTLTSVHVVLCYIYVTAGCDKIKPNMVRGMFRRFQPAIVDGPGCF